MKTALIGFSGFVGSNLRQQTNFLDLYNSKNINDIRGCEYDLLVCAGVSAVKWQANKEPERDWQSIENLLKPLAEVKAKKMVLISTVDVYAEISKVDEHTMIDPIINHPYGRHRYKVEQFVQEVFPNHYIIRLPGLFGSGLKKNVIFDLLNRNCLTMINPACSFQYYPLNRLWLDIQKVIQANIKLINFVTEPIATEDIINEFFNELTGEIGAEFGQELHYDIRTVHAELFDQEKNYILSKEQVMSELAKFINSYKK